MSRSYEIPGAPSIEVEFVLLDVNGTLTDRGELIEGVEERLARLAGELRITLLSADTLGTRDSLAGSLGLEAVKVRLGEEKRAMVQQRRAARCAAIGNGVNDAPMLEAAALGSRSWARRAPGRRRFGRLMSSADQSSGRSTSCSTRRP
jgi:soluble P-type ATPase